MKEVFRKVLILGVGFLVLSLLFTFLKREKNNRGSVTMGEPTLPVLYFNYMSGDLSSGMSVNRLEGYVNSMEQNYMRDTITPIAADGVARITIMNMDNTFNGGYYELRTLKDNNLVDKQDIESSAFTVDSEYTYLNIELPDIIDHNTEYRLLVCLKTEQNDINYYTRVYVVDNDDLFNHFNFIRNFSEGALGINTGFSVSDYIEPNSTENNSDYGNASIHSSYSHITWGEMNVERVSEPVLEIEEIIGDIVCCKYNYKVRALNDYDTYQYYKVSEYFRVKYSGGQLYLLDYVRNADQIFDPNNQNITASRINLGVCSDDEIIYKASDDSNYIAFNKCNGLWLMDIDENEVRSVFSFETPEDSDVRDVFSDNHMEIVSVSEDGDVEFIVYGYMNRGEHEGMVGLSLYKYSYEDNEVSEKIFIPFTGKYEILKETLGKLSYVNKNNIMYVMLNESVYSIDLSGSEYVEVVTGLTDDNYAINDDGDKIAWETTDSGTAVIKVLDFNSEKEEVITADEGCRIKVIDFLEDDLVYGIANESDIVTDSTGNELVPMYNIKILNEKMETVKEFSKEGNYSIGGYVDGNMLNLYMVLRSGEGYVRTDDYQLFTNEESDENDVTVSTITTTLKKQEYVINFSKKVTTSDELRNIVPKEIKFTDTKSLKLRDLIKSGEKYYAYGYGKLIGISGSAAAAVVNADLAAGVVVDENGSYVWKRTSKPESMEIAGINIGSTGSDTNSQIAGCISGMLSVNGITVDVREEVNSGKNIIEIINSRLTDKKAMDLTGCTFEEMLYYVYKNQPVMAMRDDGTYVLIVGYDFYNSVIMDVSSGATYKQGREETETMFRNAGYRFVVIME